MTPDSQSNDEEIPTIEEIPAAIEPEPAVFGAETRSSRVGRFTRLATYTSMVNVVSKNMEQLLVQIRQSIPDRVNSSEIKQEFFNHFLMVTDRFAAKCSSEFANVIRTSSIQANVRAIPQEVLSKRIRDSAFHDLDAILLSAVAILRELRIDISEALANLKESSLHDLITGKVEHKKPSMDEDEEGEAGEIQLQEEAIPMEEPAIEEEVSPELQQQQEQLRAQGQALAFSKALDYIKTIGTLPTVLVDYGARKCFGGDIDFEMQKNAVTQVENAIEQRRAKAISALIDLACAERRLVEKAPQPQAQSHSEPGHMTLEDDKTEDGGDKGQAAIGLTVAAVCLVPAGMMMILHSSAKYATFLGAVGFMGLFYAAVKSMSNRSDTEDFDTSALETETPTPETPMEQADDLPPPASPSE